MRTPIHNHFNARRLCEIDLAADVLAKLEEPPELQDPLKAEDHLVRVQTPHGEMVLFTIVVNGAPLVATPTPEVVTANAAV